MSVLHLYWVFAVQDNPQTSGDISFPPSNGPPPRPPPPLMYDSVGGGRLTPPADPYATVPYPPLSQSK